MTQERLFDLNNKSVYIAIPCYTGVIPIELGVALANTTAALINAGVQAHIASERECGLITQVRNKLVWRFLNQSDSEYLFWIDDDIIFTPSDFMQILALSTVKKLVAATYPTRTEKPVFFIQYLNGETPEWESEFGLIVAKGVGLGFTCIHRSIVEEIWNASPPYKDEGGIEAREIFKIGAKDGRYFGEDINFFNELYDRGYPVYVNPNITLKHVGRKDYMTKLQYKEIGNASTV